MEGSRKKLVSSINVFMLGFGPYSLALSSLTWPPLESSGSLAHKKTRPFQAKQEESVIYTIRERFSSSFDPIFINHYTDKKRTKNKHCLDWYQQKFENLYTTKVNTAFWNVNSKWILFFCQPGKIMNIKQQLIPQEQIRNNRLPQRKKERKRFDTVG